MDRISKKTRSANMAAIRSKGMKPEMTVRKLVHSLGYRYRLHRRDLPGTPDLVFPSKRAAIFVHGCFWHQHENCLKAHTPRSNTEYWGQKLKRNIERDKIALDKLVSMGWHVLIVWECETKNLEPLQGKLIAFLEAHPKA